MSEPRDGPVIEDQFRSEMGSALKVTWMRTRRMQPIDVEWYHPGVLLPPHMKAGRRSDLTILLDPHVVESNPIITIVAGDRTFRVVEEIR